jgi:hypothetical protein
VCGCPAVRQYAAVRLVVYGSAHGNAVRLCGNAAVCDSVQQCTRLSAAVRTAVWGSVWECVAVRKVLVCAQCAQCAWQCAAVWQCVPVRVAMCGSVRGSVRVWLYVAVCGSARGSVWQCAQQCAAVRLVMCAQCAWQCAAVRQCAAVCGSVRQCAWLCVAVRTVVCTQCVRQYVAVRLVVYGSARGSVRLSGSAAVCGSVRGSVRLCVAVCGSARGSVWQYTRQCVAVRTVMCAQCARQCVAVRVEVCGSAHGSVQAVRPAVCVSPFCGVSPKKNGYSTWEL